MDKKRVSMSKEQVKIDKHNM